MARWTALLVAILISVVAADAEAGAPLVTLDDAAPSLEKADDAWTTSLGFTNVTGDEVPLAVTNGGSRCSGTLGKEPEQQSIALRAALHTAVKLTVPGSCTSPGKSLVLSLTAGAAPTVQTIRIEATAKEPEKKPDWKQLMAFVYFAVGLGILGLVLWVLWDVQDGKLDRFFEPMPYVDATWSFKDSWASNVTIGGALLTGIFGSSEVVKAILGEDSTASIALATVGVAIAAGLIGAGGLVALATKTRDGDFTVGGLLAASVITLTGASGELWAVYASARVQVSGSVRDLILGVTLAGLLLLVVYAARSLLSNFDAGTTPPDPVDHLKKPLTETMFAASMMVDALKCRCAPGEVDSSIGDLRIANYDAGIKKLQKSPDVSADQVATARKALLAIREDLDLRRFHFVLAALINPRSALRRNRLPIEPPRLNALRGTLDEEKTQQLDASIKALASIHEDVDETHAAAAAVDMVAGEEPDYMRPRSRRPRAALL